MKIPYILTLAGSDSGGGAGIQADIKTITSNGGFAASVVTALTAQNSQGVAAVHEPPVNFLQQQLEAVLTDFKVDAAKTGMLFSEDIIETVASKLHNKSFGLVVDPVCVSQTGHSLLQKNAVNALKKKIVPLADLITPNRPEAELLTGLKISGRKEIEEAAKKLQDMGAGAVLIKGGHFEAKEGTMTDWLALPGQDIQALALPYIQTENTHGTGCTLSAAIATNLGHGQTLEQAVKNAQAYLNFCLKHSIRKGHGAGTPNHMA